MASTSQPIAITPETGILNIDTHQYLNILMSNMVFKQMTSILESDNKTILTGKNILKLFALMSLDEIRKIFMSAIKSIFKYVSENYLKVFEWINNNIFQNYFIKLLFNIFNKFMKLFKKKEKTLVLPELNVSTFNSLNVKMKSNNEFFDSLIKYVKNNETCSYLVSNTKHFELKDLKNIITKETWSNIKIEFQDVNIHINNSLILEFTSNKNSTKLKSMLRNGFIDVSIEYESLIDLIPDVELREYFQKVYNNLAKSNFAIHLNYTDFKSLLNFKQEQDKINFLKKYYPLLSLFKFGNLEKTIIIYHILINTCCMSNLGSPLLKNILSRIDKSFLESYINYPFGCSGAILNTFGYSGNFKELCEAIMENEVAKKYIEKKDKNDTNTQMEEQHLIDFTILGEGTEEEINITFNNFIKEISSYVEPSTKNQKIKVNIIKIKKTKVINSTPNPDYIAYEEQKANIRELASKDKDDIAIKEFLLKTPPNKTIDNIEIKKEVLVEQINELHKSFDTLYLRKQDQEKLKKVLHSFLHQMELYEELGLPNKLNVFLSGLPGTGKTTIIQVIASYLQKNIYYCNINDEMTNDDVQMIFDYVIKNSIGGGIIVTEDVDAMTKIVHKRISSATSTSSQESTTMEIYEAKDKSLTLEYLLNLLQGSLTQDGTIFIATTNHKELIDPAFYRDGRFDVKIDMKLCDQYQVNCIYKKFMNREVPEEVLERIQEDTYTPANIIFRVKDYIVSDLSDEAILEPFII
jgi:ATP-dependent 26S proteasome regulatory subunit